jgi:hypothetical protein
MCSSLLALPEQGLRAPPGPALEQQGQGPLGLLEREQQGPEPLGLLEREQQGPEPLALLAARRLH